MVKRHKNERTVSCCGVQVRF
uniref:Uncharacterized protein n=1 Tax=Arundo donax TaxID=35708 RepID=A0A0A9BIU3_ARUDO